MSRSQQEFYSKFAGYVIAISLAHGHGSGGKINSQNVGVHETLLPPEGVWALESFQAFMPISFGSAYQFPESVQSVHTSTFISKRCSDWSPPFGPNQRPSDPVGRQHQPREVISSPPAGRPGAESPPSSIPNQRPSDPVGRQHQPREVISSPPAGRPGAESPPSSIPNQRPSDPVGRQHQPREVISSPPAGRPGAGSPPSSIPNQRPSGPVGKQHQARDTAPLSGNLAGGFGETEDKYYVVPHQPDSGEQEIIPMFEPGKNNMTPYTLEDIQRLDPSMASHISTELIHISTQLSQLSTNSNRPAKNDRKKTRTKVPPRNPPVTES